MEAIHHLRCSTDNFFIETGHEESEDKTPRHEAETLVLRFRELICMLSFYMTYNNIYMKLMLVVNHEC